MSPALTHIPPGNPGTDVTVGAMWRLMLKYSPRVRAQAEEILRQYQVSRLPNVFKAGALFEWVQQHLAYTNDHALVEEIHGADYSLDQIEAHEEFSGDCDDAAILLGALLLSIGIEFSIARVSTQETGLFDHVFLLLLDHDGPIAMDVIAKDEDGNPVPFGWHLPPERVTNFAESFMPTAMEAVGL